MHRIVPLVALLIFSVMPAGAQVPPRVPNTTLQMPAEALGAVAYQMENISPGAIGAPPTVPSTRSAPGCPESTLSLTGLGPDVSMYVYPDKNSELITPVLPSSAMRSSPSWASSPPS